MNTTLEPRPVERPFVRRWLKTALALFVRTPLRFGLLIGLLGWLDTTVSQVARGHLIPRAAVDRCGLVVLPVFWIITAAVARGADDHRLTRPSLAGLARRAVWVGAFGAGTLLALLNWSIAVLLQWIPLLLGRHEPRLFRPLQGEFLTSVESGVLLTSITVGLCYFPLLVCNLELTPLHAAALSRRASDRNQPQLLILLMGILVLSATLLAAVLPAYGITAAAFLVFVGVLNYVAYREIFEGRSDNAPQPAAQPGTAVGAAVRAPAR